MKAVAFPELTLHVWDEKTFSMAKPAVISIWYKMVWCGDCELRHLTRGSEEYQIIVCSSLSSWWHICWWHDAGKTRPYQSSLWGGKGRTSVFERGFLEVMVFHYMEVCCSMLGGRCCWHRTAGIWDKSLGNLGFHSVQCSYKPDMWAMLSGEMKSVEQC